MERKIPLYRQLVNELEKQIDSGVFCIGAKLPSVRELAAARKVSVITVLKAYQMLENKGMIHSMPKSGYYISFHKAGSANLPGPSVPQEVHISGLVQSFTEKKPAAAVFSEQDFRQMTLCRSAN